MIQVKLFDITNDVSIRNLQDKLNQELERMNEDDNVIAVENIKLSKNEKTTTGMIIYKARKL